MYKWNSLTKEQQKEIQAFRQKNHIPWHSPPHYEIPNNIYLISATNYRHQIITGLYSERMSEFETTLRETLSKYCQQTIAWCLLPNHYHCIIETSDLRYTVYGLGQLHGRTSRAWNLEDKSPGRKCWYRCTDRAMRSEKQLYAAVNYVHYNPVKHGYIEKMTDWAYSSSRDFITDIGKDKATEIWKQYPISNLEDWEAEC